MKAAIITLKVLEVIPLKEAINTMEEILEPMELIKVKACKAIAVLVTTREVETMEATTIILLDRVDFTPKDNNLAVIIISHNLNTITISEKE
jgi:hypothetical protein